MCGFISVMINVIHYINKHKNPLKNYRKTRPNGMKLNKTIQDLEIRNHRCEHQQQNTRDGSENLRYRRLHRTQLSKNKTLHDSLELILRSTHPFSGSDPEVLHHGQHSGDLSSLCWPQKEYCWEWPQPEWIPASGLVGFLRLCSCWHKTLFNSLELMLHSTHPWSWGDPEILRFGEHSAALSGLPWAQK